MKVFIEMYKRAQSWWYRIVCRGWLIMLWIELILLHTFCRHRITFYWRRASEIFIFPFNKGKDGLGNHRKKKLNIPKEIIRWLLQNKVSYCNADLQRIVLHSAWSLDRYLHENSQSSLWTRTSRYLMNRLTSFFSALLIVTKISHS